MASENIYRTIGDAIGNVADNIRWGKDAEPILRSNKAINFLAGEANTGFRGVLNGLADNKKLGNAVKDAYMTGNDFNYKAIAGSYIGGSIAGRVVTGGGLYKDRNGNNNLIGVPFV